MDNSAVTPYAGVWIEIFSWQSFDCSLVSLPTRECGLKLKVIVTLMNLVSVTPYAGVWIEILS